MHSKPVIRQHQGTTTPEISRVETQSDFQPLRQLARIDEERISRSVPALNVIIKPTRHDTEDGAVEDRSVSLETDVTNRGEHNFARRSHRKPPLLGACKSHSTNRFVERIVRVALLAWHTSPDVKRRQIARFELFDRIDRSPIDDVGKWAVEFKLGSHNARLVLKVAFDRPPFTLIRAIDERDASSVESAWSFSPLYIDNGRCVPVIGFAQQCIRLRWGKFTGDVRSKSDCDIIQNNSIVVVRTGNVDRIHAVNQHVVIATIVEKTNPSETAFNVVRVIVQQ